MPVDREAVARALAEANARTGLFRTGQAPVETERAAGWYWVSANGGVPEIAEWDAADRRWRSTYWQAANGMGTRVVVLSPRLTPPEPGTAAPEPAPRLRVRWGVPVGDAPDGDRPPKSPPDGIPPPREGAG